MLSIIQAAGWPIWTLILCFILALALIIERLVQLRTHKVMPPKTLEQAIEISRGVVPSEEMVLKHDHKDILGPVLASGLRCVQKNSDTADDDIRALMLWRNFRSLVDNKLRSMEVVSDQFARHISHLRN